ncbi:LysM peptidoglycan-binding domain-containing protein [Candidatus Symbiobacter mobilis]|uniref:LysM-domain-containing protein n=1 Tax=Candidatus Symbiobacter mobilis CR TaxID=946483 RepID=U5NCI6_9BURK|nr:LysM domain-containing protein [Candidatus Symbiobacter mobilis]AGX87859.1 LysM-domain-containing protein [Candidatus Symbiobacter mobilis CR]
MHTLPRPSGAVALTLALLLAAFAQGSPASTYDTPTPRQRATAKQVAVTGVPLGELAANAPSSYTIQAGDTLWGIAGMFLRSVWRWPELWGMNLDDIQNPHLIYPGQVLYLDTRNGRAFLRTRPGGGVGGTPTVRLSPRTRIEPLSAGALPTLQSHLIEPFLAEPIIVGEGELAKAARIVATLEGRVLLTRGDRAYARGPFGAELLDDPTKKHQIYRIFRNTTALRDPITGEVLGHEAQYVGTARLMRSESTQTSVDAEGKEVVEILPATIDIIAAKEEMRVGDRLLPEPPREVQSYAPHAPAPDFEARVVSVYGSAVANAAQNQVVAISRGVRDGVESGHIFAILNDGERIIDKTDPERPQIKLPEERNGLMMVFRTFDRVSYALVLNITRGVKVGDRLISPMHGAR